MALDKNIKLVQEIDENTYGCEAALVSAKYSISLIQLLLAHLPEYEKQAILEVIKGIHEPSGLLPFQMPANMKTVELQAEDTPRDMECYQDSDGNIYDFAFGLNWSGTIDDERVKRYR